MGRKKPRKGICVYCGKEKEKAQMTEHHVPPECLFAPNAREHLVKVPCCIPCHRSFSDDDEYFKLVLVLREDVKNHPDVKELIPGVMRSLHNPKKPGYRNAFLKTLRKVHPTTPSGLILPAKGAFEAKTEPLERVARRIVLGLFYHETGRRLPDEYEVSVHFAETLRAPTQEDAQQFKRDILTPLGCCEPRIRGRGVFKYQVGFAANEPNVSAWLLLFYNRVALIGVSLKQEDAISGTSITP